MRYDLAAIASRGTNRRRRTVTLRPIVPTQALAADLYQRTYRRVIEALTASLPALLAAYERGRAQLVTDAAADETGSVLSSIGDLLNRLATSLVPGLELWAQAVENWHRGKWRGAVLTASGVDLNTVLLASGKPQSIGETVAWNTALIRDVGDQARSRMASTIFAAFQARQPVTEVARDLREVVSMSRRRALGIASDQTSKLAAALDRERATDAGIEEYVWRHSSKRHPRPEHLARNGQVFRYDDPPTLGGVPDPPGHAPNCGCRGQARLTF